MVFRIKKPIKPESTEAIRTAIFARLNTAGSENANCDTKNDMVKPIPPRKPIPII